jgi:hypothetical protein
VKESKAEHRKHSGQSTEVTEEETRKKRQGRRDKEEEG